MLDVKITERGESFYNPYLAQVVEELENRHLVTLSAGAKCIFVAGFANRDGEPLPIIVQKSDGGFNYSTTDLAALRHRIRDEKADRIIYVVDAGQSMHFQMLFKVAEQAGYITDKITVNHVPFGLVLGADGKKFRTRAGDTERLIDLLQTAVSHAKTILAERKIPEDEEELNSAAVTLGINAIKYADLSSNRTHDYAFSYDRMLRFEGNTAAFLMYAYVRINGIKRKVGIDASSFLTSDLTLTHPAEMLLAAHLNRFVETLEQMTQDLLPNRLADYLFNLAEHFNIFFRDCRVQGSPEQNSRLLLCEATARVMQTGMNILGLKVLERM